MSATYMTIPRVLAVSAAISTAAIVVSAPSLMAQQQGSSKQQTQAQQQNRDQQPGTQQQPQSSDLRAVITTLEQAKNSFSSSPQQAAQQANNGLDQAASTLRSMSAPDADKQAANQSIDQARQAVSRSPVDAQQATTAIDRTIQRLQSLQQQVGQAGSPPQQAGTSTGRASGAQPQITVQQRPADVQVTQPQPQITVTQPRPEVQITQPRPEVTVQMPEPKVSVQQAEPNVNVQRTGEPKVTVQQPQSSQQQQPGSATGSAAGTARGQSTANVDTGISTMGRTLVGKTVYGTNGNQIAEVEDVVMGQGGRIQSVLMDIGGFLGIGQKRVAVPVERLRLQGDRIMTDMTEQQAKDLPAHRG